MRPLRLEVEGFACYRDRQPVLEFSELTLFAIAGPTGAGKSSILDAMLYALFGEVPRIGWLLFVATIVWVLIYDTEYAMVDREDDLRIGVNSTAVLLGDMDRTAIAGLQALFLVTLVLVGRNAELGAWYYGGVGVALALSFYQQFLMRNREPEGCFRAFSNNAWLGGFVFVGIVLDYVFRGATQTG